MLQRGKATHKMQPLTQMSMLQDGSASVPRSTSQEEVWAQRRTATEKRPGHIDTWDALLVALHQYLKGKAMLDIPLKIKKDIHLDYQRLLERFPYLVQHWKDWLILEYKLNGIQKSINVLSQAVTKFSHSVELWHDYLSALISQYQKNPTETALKHTRFQYKCCIEKTGYHFNGHLVWDMILNFEKLVNSLSIELLNLYRVILEIPCYQYAQYHSQFGEIKLQFTLQDILDPEVLDQYLKRYKLTFIDQLSPLDKQHIVDDWSRTLFNSVQKWVGEKWEFESLLHYQLFSATKVQAMEDELPIWINYLKNEVYMTHGKRNEIHAKVTIDLFERALVPYCWNNKLWLMYISYLSQVLKPEEKQDRIMAVYETANVIIPLDQVHVRLSFTKFLLKYSTQDNTSEYLLNLLQKYLHTMPFLRKQASSILESLLQMWQRLCPISSVLNSCELILSDHLKLDQPLKKVETNSVVAKELINDRFRLRISKILNNDLVASLAVYYLRLLQSSGTPQSREKIRIFYNTNHKHDAFKSSTIFYKFYVDFEGIVNGSAQNLSIVSRYISTKSQLPKAAIDALTEHVYEIVSANLSGLMPGVCNRTDILFSRDNELSNSLTHNVPASLRQLTNNYWIMENSKGETDVSQVLQMVSKNAANPGFVVEAFPEITNPSRQNYIPIGASLEPARLSTFKNVERANAHAKTFKKD